MPNCDLSFKKTNLEGYKEVIIIGNGPCGLALSYYLSGQWPYWNGNRVQDEYFQMRLESCGNECSLVEQDLEFLSDGLMGRSRNPVALLFDKLNHPEDEFGDSMPNCLTWRHESNREIDHLVIGKTQPGGSWNNFEPNQLSISLANWMELPDMDLKVLQSRAYAKQVLNYYQEYVHEKNLEKYLLNNAIVTRVHKINDLWQISGSLLSEKRLKKRLEFTFYCKHLVIATGTCDIPNELKVFGESFPFILKTIKDFEEKLKKDLTSLRTKPLLVVGSGVSALDCILLALNYKLKIVHVMRRSIYDSQNLIFSNLSKSLYPEYNSIYELMLKTKLNASNTSDYVFYDEHTIQSFTTNRECLIKSIKNSNIIQLEISFACLLIGSSSNLSYLPASIRKNLALNSTKPINSRSNPILVDPFTLESLNTSKLYAMGPLIGDNFVRFGIGGALAITNSIWKDKNS